MAPLVLFFFSGVAGLVYEVLWVRQFGNVLGNSVHSASLVTAVFMCGLGAGGWLGGGWADRAAARGSGVRVLFRAYGAAELGIGTFGLLLAAVLPRLGGLSVSLSSYAQGANGWYSPSFGADALRYVIAVLLIAPPTLLMGATLTLLVRAIVAADVSQTGLRIGVLYGANTAGAALGAIAVDAWLVEAIGVFHTQLVAALLNASVGAAAMLLAARAGDRPLVAEADSAAPEAGTPASTRAPTLAGVALALSGFAALGMEIVWFRFLSATIGGYRAVFSLVLAVVCVGIWLGSTAGGLLQRRFGRPLDLFVVSQALFALVALASMVFFSQPPISTYGAAAWGIVAVVGLPSILMGLSFPLVNAHVQDALGVVGRRTGYLYAANTAGCVLGSLVAGFVLAPWIGSQASFAVFAVAAVLAPAPLLFSSSTLRARKLAGVAGAVAVPVIAAWLALPADFVAKRFLTRVPYTRVLEASEGANEMIHVVDCGGECRALLTNGHPMSNNSVPNQRYMRAFAHLPLLSIERPSRALVICFGVGNTLHATTLHPSLTRIEIADLSRNVLDHASAFRATNHDVLADPRVSVFVEDGRQHLRTQPAATYDLVTLEPPPIGFAGVSSLYSREFYELVKSRLAPGGMMTQWLPAYQVPPEVGLAMVRAFIDVFPSSVLLSGSGAELILMGSTAPELTLDLDRIDSALRERPAVLADLRRIRMGTLTELVGMFVADGDAMRRATVGVTPITDDRPSMEYSFGRGAGMPAALFAGAAADASVRRYCPKCFAGDGLDPRVAWLPGYLEVVRRVYATPAFLRNSTPFAIGDVRSHAEAFSRSAYLRSLAGVTLGGPPSASTDPPEALAHFRKGSALSRQGQFADAAREFEAGLAIAPRNADARYDLAAVYLSLGREEEAVGLARKVLEQQPSHANAATIVCSLRGESCPR